MPPRSMRWWCAGPGLGLYRNSRTWRQTGSYRLLRVPMRSWRKNTSANRVKKGGAAALLIAVACLAGGSSVPGDRWFEDVTQKAGVAHKHTNREFKNPYAHIMAGYTALGASAAVADYDGDGLDDVFVTDSKENGKNRLYHNNGNFTFTDVAEKAGLANGNDSENASADALWLDFNNDGRPDLLV